MIDTRHFILLENNGYANKSDAYAIIRVGYSYLKGVTTYYDNGLWYIVQSKALMQKCQTEQGGEKLLQLFSLLIYKIFFSLYNIEILINIDENEELKDENISIAKKVSNGISCTANGIPKTLSKIGKKSKNDPYE